MKTVYITPSRRLFEAEEHAPLNLKRREVGKFSPVETEQGEISYDDQVDSQLSQIDNTKIGNEFDTLDAQNIYRHAKYILDAHLIDIKYNMKYEPKVAVSGMAQKVNPLDIYSIEIVEVGPNAAWQIYEPEKEISSTPIVNESAGETPQYIQIPTGYVPANIFKTIIESQQFKKTFGADCKYIQARLKVE